MNQLQKIIQQETFRLTTAFIGTSNLKSRIMKINQKPSAKSARMRFLFIPILVGLGMACTSQISTHLSISDNIYTDYWEEEYHNYQSRLWIKQGQKTHLKFYFPKGFKGYFHLLSSKLDLNVIQANLQLYDENSNSQKLVYESVMNKYYFNIPATGTYTLEIDNSKSLSSIFLATHFEKKSIGIDEHTLVKNPRFRYKSVDKNFPENLIMLPVFSLSTQVEEFKLRMQAGKKYWFSIKENSSKSAKLEVSILTPNGQLVSNGQLVNNYQLNSQTVLIFPCEKEGDYLIKTSNNSNAYNLNIEYHL